MPESVLAQQTVFVSTGTQFQPGDTAVTDVQVNYNKSAIYFTVLTILRSNFTRTHSGLEYVAKTIVFNWVGSVSISGFQLFFWLASIVLQEVISGI